MNYIDFIPVGISATLLLVGYFICNKMAYQITTKAYLNGRADAYIDAANDCAGVKDLGQMQRLMFNKSKTEKEILEDFNKDSSIIIFRGTLSGINTPQKVK